MSSYKYCICCLDIKRSLNCIFKRMLWLSKFFRHFVQSVLMKSVHESVEIISMKMVYQP